MTFETGIFYEVHKYARNFNLPLYFVVEDNGVSTQTQQKQLGITEGIFLMM